VTVGKLVADANYLALNHSRGSLEFWVSHPRQVRASNYLLAAMVRKAVEALFELLMPLPEVHYLVANLGLVLPLRLELVLLKKLVPRNGLSDI
jgi:hypothetical protein